MSSIPTHRVEATERDFEVNALLDRIERDVQAVVASGAGYALEARLKRILPAMRWANPTMENARA